MAGRILRGKELTVSKQSYQELWIPFAHIVPRDRRRDIAVEGYGIPVDKRQ